MPCSPSVWDNIPTFHLHSLKFVSHDWIHNTCNYTSILFVVNIPEIRLECLWNKYCSHIFHTFFTLCYISAYKQPFIESLNFRKSFFKTSLLKQNYINVDIKLHFCQNQPYGLFSHRLSYCLCVTDSNYVHIMFVFWVCSSSHILECCLTSFTHWVSSCAIYIRETNSFHMLVRCSK